MNKQELLDSDSFIELGARDRARVLLDPGSMRELIGPFDRVKSPWLERQGIVTQADDGAIVARGTIDGQNAVVLAIEGSFQGGSMGEVSGAKLAGALELAAEDNHKGIPTRAVLLLETGGVRLQEANLGLAAIAEIHAAITALRGHQPVIAVVAGTVGCFGGMSVAAALCSYVVVTREARYGLNGPQVIEQEAGIAEYDSRDRPFIWSLSGGEQRYVTGLADRFVDDNVHQISSVIRELYRTGVPELHRDQQVDQWLALLNQIDTSVQPDSASVRQIIAKGLKS